jgi:alkylhydroperoxidase/carboxymuconolactone decarboxylase family protein YurZ
MTGEPPNPSPEAVRARLDEIRATRGFLLPHHGPMAAALPDLHDAYGAMYRALTLTERHLTPFEKEFVWLAILTAAEEHVGTHHVALFHRTGGTPRQAEAAFRLVAWARGAETFAFLDRHWQGHFPDLRAADAYRAGTAALIAGLDVPAPLARLALLGVQAARGAHWPLATDIEAAYGEAVPEPKMAEAMSLVMWPCGVNRFLEACGAWLQVLRSGRVVPSPAFRAWAETPDQEGFALPPRGAAPAA